MELSLLEDSVAEVSRRVEHYAKRVKARPHLERRSNIETKLRELHAVDRFPEGGVERLNLLLSQHRVLTEERKKNESEAEALRLRRLQMRVDPEEWERRAHVLESLRNLLPQIDATRRVYTAGIARRDAIGQERNTLLRALAVTTPPSNACGACWWLIRITPAPGCFSRTSKAVRTW